MTPFLVDGKMELQSKYRFPEQSDFTMKNRRSVLSEKERKKGGKRDRTFRNLIEDTSLQPNTCNVARRVTCPGVSVTKGKPRAKSEMAKSRAARASKTKCIFIRACERIKVQFRWEVFQRAIEI